VESQQQTRLRMVEPEYLEDTAAQSAFDLAGADAGQSGDEFSDSVLQPQAADFPSRAEERFQEDFSTQPKEIMDDSTDQEQPVMVPLRRVPRSQDEEELYFGRLD